MSHKPSTEEIARAVKSLAQPGMVKYFPLEQSTLQVIMHELKSMVPTITALHWLVEQYIRKIGEWHSLKELRAVLCTYCDPLDGVFAVSTLPGYTPAEVEAKGERAYHERQATETARVLEARKQLPEYNDPVVEAELQAGKEALVRRFADWKRGQQEKREAKRREEIQVLNEMMRSRKAGTK